MTRREELIIEMLRLRQDVILGTGTGATAAGGYSLAFGSMFGSAFRELERLLDAMRAERPRQRRHVIARFVECDRRPIVVPFTRRKVRGVQRFEFRLPPHTELAIAAAAPSVLDDKTARVLVYQWPAWVRNRDVEHGVEWLAASFVGVPGIPKEMAEAA